MKTHSLSSFIAVAAALIMCTTMTAQAQITMFIDDITSKPVSLSVSELRVDAVPSSVLVNASRTWWKAVRAEHIRALRASDTRAQSLQNIIFLATHFPQQSTFSSREIYEVYRLDADERVRIMALAALHAIGNEDTMRQLARDVQLEASPRVRRLTTGAVNDYFKSKEK